MKRKYSFKVFKNGKILKYGQAFTMTNDMGFFRYLGKYYTYQKVYNLNN